ncbi:MAG: hypothetical protein JJ896_16870 [Rhodothermales bacterium]|nr:hypothetical protein [Rhodothermales bacterium]MBO6781332.1 hypothetical protein [Rhodothermales bacterium]
MKIPAHIAWPLFVVALLVSGMAAGLSVVYFAHSDGGVQVVRDEPRPGLAPATDSSEAAPARQ